MFKYFCHCVLFIFFYMGFLPSKISNFHSGRSWSGLASKGPSISLETWVRSQLANLSHQRLKFATSSKVVGSCRIGYIGFYIMYVRTFAIYQYLLRPILTNQHKITQIKTPWRQWHKIHKQLHRKTCLKNLHDKIATMKWGQDPGGMMSVTGSEELVGVSQPQHKNIQNVFKKY